MSAALEVLHISAGNLVTQEDGQSVVEFALVFPLLVLLLMGTFDLGLAFFQYNAVSNVAREAARYAIAREHQPLTQDDFTAGASNPRSNTAAIQWAKDRAVGLNQALLIIHVYSETDWTQRNSWGYTITATVDYPYAAITPFVPQGTITLRSRAVMVTE